MDSLDNEEVPVQPSSEVSNVVTQPEQPVEVTSSKPKAKTLVVVIIVLVCLMLLGGGTLLLRKFVVKRMAGVKPSYSGSGLTDSRNQDGSVCGRIKQAILDQRKLEELGKKVAKSNNEESQFESKLVFESDNEIPTQFPKAHFPVMPGSNLCHSLVTNIPDEDTGMVVVSEVYYEVSSASAFSRWLGENFKSSDVSFEHVAVQEPGDTSKEAKSMFGAIAMPMYKVTNGNYDIYHWETGCCSPGQSFEELATVYISLDEKLPLVLYRNSKETFYYRK